MKIGIILLSNGWAGAERVVYNLAQALAKIKDVNVVLFLNKEIYHLFEIEGMKKFDIGSASSLNKFVSFNNFLKLKRNLKNLSESENLDIVNCHMEMAYLVSPKNNLVIVSHGPEIENFVKPPGIYYRMFVYNKAKECFDKCKKIVSVSNWQKQKLPEIYKKKTAVIPNGIDLKTFKVLKDVKKKSNVILFTGRYIERKGCLEVLKVAKLLPQYEFWFVGQGPFAGEINLPNTKDLGFKSTEELVSIYNQAQLCVFPAYWEALPLCGLEAMACGKAVIATPLGFSEYIESGKDGIIVPIKDVNALQEAIIKLMSDDNLREKIENNALMKVMDYSWENVARQYHEIFENILKDHAGNTGLN